MKGKLDSSIIDKILRTKHSRHRIDDGLTVVIETLFAKYPDVGAYLNNDKKIS